MPISPVISHQDECCTHAKEWFITLDASLRDPTNVWVGPTWISEKYQYGPSSWPLHWCKLIQMDSLSCNGFTSIACLIFKGRGLKAFPVQVIQRYPRHMTQRWRKEWKSRRLLDEWIYDELVRHEVCGVVDDENNLRLWDGTVGYWLEPVGAQEVGAVLALRPIGLEEGTPDKMKWEDHIITTNEWTRVGMEEE